MSLPFYTTVSGIIAGLALNPKNITETIGVVKAYTTRVSAGAGACKTEDLGEYCHPTHYSAFGNEAEPTMCATGSERNSRKLAENGEHPQAPKTLLWLARFVNASRYFFSIKLAVAYSDLMDLVV
ncbi:Adenylosuccinate synthase [Metarhizium acridum]|nr:Adenylosuccinate synthase [Metarhizium acridum]